MIEGVWSFQCKASTFISFIEMDIYSIKNFPYLSVSPPFSLHVSPGYVFFFFPLPEVRMAHFQLCLSTLAN